MSISRSALRRLLTVPALVGALAILVAAPAFAQDASPEPSASAGASMSVEASPAPVASFFPIPDTVLPIPSDLSTVSLEPESAASLTVGEPVPYALGHCGLWSPIDVDGSLWQPVGGTAADGGPIESDEAIGELINATAGELLLTSPDEATFTTAGGSAIFLVRAPGALDYPLCM
jgi:hypothetical protein